MAVLAAILLVVAYNMGEWREIPELWKQGWTDRLVWMVTFALTVLADLTVAVEAGMILAALLFIRRVSATTTVSRVTPDYIRRGREHVAAGQGDSGLRGIFRIHGPFLFGATDKLAAAVAHVDELRADRHPAAAEHDGHRRDRPAGDPGLADRCTLAADAAAVRRTAAAGAADGRSRVPSPRRRGEHPAARRGRARTGRTSVD